MTMKQQVMTKPGEIKFQEVPIPEPMLNEVLIRVMRIGICGSDIHVNHGEHPFTKYPITQGHEISGEVVSFGANVTDFHEGQKVTIQPQVFCGKCHPCLHGKYNLCENLKVMGFQTTGLASEYFSIDQSKVTPLPEDMTFEEGALMEPLAVAVHAVNRADEPEGANIVVIGAGPIGNLVAQAAKALGANRVLITDVSDIRLGIAKECSIDYCLNTKNEDLGEAITKYYGSDKADYIFDCAGNDITINQAIKYARKGSRIILVAVFADLAKVDLAVLNDHELTLDTSMMYRNEDFLQAIQLVNKGKIDLSTLISIQFPFEEFKSAYDYIDNNREKTMKVIINVQ